ncbi:hypothetical protein CS022_03445 [Veronia nyctiphanis]|uniref:Uncharacterized protein n=1 Tax=Veronia nyctiphanis TaxID=1278244 RepID=A0A4Q0YZM6_9GAMM|nr:hypothetical protein [Veronia nyctiphanis]RXJ74629.1 hypothetical protein CS022_03445 [Veronia nyctiphanis]
MEHIKFSRSISLLNSIKQTLVQAKLKINQFWFASDEESAIRDLKARLDDQAFLQDIGLTKERVEKEIERLNRK